MRGLLWNLVLALVWAALTGQFTVTNLAVGFAFGTAVLWFAGGPAGAPHYLRRLRRAVGLVAFFLWELLLANLRVAYDVVTPRHQMRPGVIAVPLDARTDAEILTLVALTTLTPGTLALDLSSDRRVLYIHTMYLDDPETFRRYIKDGFERRVLEVLQ